MGSTAQEKITVRRLFDCSPDILSAMKDAAYDWPELAQEVEAGVVGLYEVNQGRAYAVLRNESPELVVCVYQGEGLKQFADYMYENAGKNGFKSVRFHTRRPGIARMIKHLNPEPVEHVLRVKING